MNDAMQLLDAAKKKHEAEREEKKHADAIKAELLRKAFDPVREFVEGISEKETTDKGKTLRDCLCGPAVDYKTRTIRRAASVELTLSTRRLVMRAEFDAAEIVISVGFGWDGALSSSTAKFRDIGEALLAISRHLAPFIRLGPGGFNGGRRSGAH